jgi:hypothetical protein
MESVFEELLKDSDDWDQSFRRDYSIVLQGLCSIKGVPEGVKKMIQSLKKSKVSSGTTVIAQNGSTVNNNDIHDNKEVNTK